MKLRSGRIIEYNVTKAHNRKKYRNKSCISELITFSIISCSMILFAIMTHQQGLWNNFQENIRENYDDTIKMINPFSTFGIMNITSQEFIPRSLFSNLF
jgi:hypothetical protein